MNLEIGDLVLRQAHKNKIFIGVITRVSNFNTNFPTVRIKTIYLFQRTSFLSRVNSYYDKAFYYSNELIKL